MTLAQSEKNPASLGNDGLLLELFRSQNARHCAAPPRGWLDVFSKYVPGENIATPGLTDLNSTEHGIFQYEDTLFEESRKLRGKGANTTS